jgi:hypothetical protein
VLGELKNLFSVFSTSDIFRICSEVSVEVLDRSPADGQQQQQQQLANKFVEHKLVSHKNLLEYRPRNCSSLLLEE